jgi:N-methylhydantoinase B
VRSYRALTDGQLFSASFGRNKFPAWGADGGADGSFNYFEFHRANGAVEGPMGVAARVVLNKDDVARMVTCTGGGYGSPKKRDPKRVAEDVRNGYISFAQAKEDYGVTVEPDTFAVTKIER